MQNVKHSSTARFAAVAVIITLIFGVHVFAQEYQPSPENLQARREFQDMKFGMFMAAEFLHAFTISVLTAILFLGGWRGIGADIPGAAGFDQDKTQACKKRRVGFWRLHCKIRALRGWDGILTRPAPPRSLIHSCLFAFHGPATVR